MSIGLLGKKLGMTHIYDEYGRQCSATAIHAGPCTIVGLREPQKHRYRALEVAFEPVKESSLTKPRLGQFKKAGTGAFRYVREFRLPESPSAAPAKSEKSEQPEQGSGESNGTWKIGDMLTVELFQQYELVDVTGVSIGKGFQGGMKRWHWSGGPATHGSMSHRRPGSIGSTTTPGRVWRGHHLPGHMGADRVTIQNLRILRIDVENHLILVEGAIPGAENELVMVRKAMQRPGVIKKPAELQLIIEEDENLSKTAKAASKKIKTPSKA
jgi:large subunit ribosomal protein L3